MMTSSIYFGSKKIDFAITYSNRKSLGITVTPEQQVVVKAPTGTTAEKIQKKLQKRASWIVRQQNFFLSFCPRTPERRFVSGETHLYLGRQYRLKILQAEVDSVQLKGKFIIVSATDSSKSKLLLDGWYRKNAEVKFSLIAGPLIEKFKKYKVVPAALVMKEMPSRWGSCTAKGKIILNPELIKASKACIEYVIIHELCHLVHHNHTRKFMELQTREMPDWERWKLKLETLLS